ncbi:MAG: NAD(P)H-dependent oxidoreductase subunit E [Deltaproteobacteria bacterium]|nr:MAG: NAD(P)H-dependent oxidoreductase subunit E [Deltaproteobacteria bacterium]
MTVFIISGKKGALDDLINERFAGDKENLIMILQAINKEYNYLPRPALTYVSTRLDVPLSQIYGIATFYSMFSLEPRGRNIVTICLGTACHVRGGERIKERLESYLGIHAGDTTEDMRFTLETVRCIGCCSLGPVVTVNEKVYARTDSEKTLKTLDQYE